MSPLRFHKTWVPVAVLTLILGGVYAGTIAPGLTWGHNGADGGDFIAAAATGGIPHPSGYPTYLLLARLFQILPIGSLAFRTNLLSAVCAIGAAIMVYLLVARLPGFPGPTNWLGGLVAALAFGLSPLMWSQAVITEIYCLQAFFVALILYSLLDGFSLPGKSSLLFNGFLGLVCGLALGNHLTTMFILPLVFLIGIVGRPEEPEKNRIPKWKIEWNSLAGRLGGLLLGLLVYLVLPIRAFSNPPINWGDPKTLGNFIWLVSGKLYAGRLFAIPADLLVPRFQSWGSQFIDQYGWIGLVVGLYGLLSGYGPATNKLYLATGWIFISFSVFSIGYNSYDSDVYLIFSFMAFAIWVGIGAAAIVDQLARRKTWMGVAAGVLIAFGLLIPAIYHYPAMDVSHDERAENFGREVLSMAPPDAILLTDGDNASFALWYFHFALHQRPDAAVIVRGLLSYDWYRATLISTDPALIIPAGPSLSWDQAILDANPGRAICSASYQDQMEFSCH